MDQKTPNSPTPKKKLTNEELMAGKWNPEEEEAKSSDPRLKDPDEFLLKLLAQKKSTNSASGDLKKGEPVQRGDSERAAEEGNEPAEPKASTKNLSARQNSNFENLEAHVVEKEFFDASSSTSGKPLDLGEIQRKKWMALKEMYDRDMMRWKEYEQNVIHWRDKVLQIVQRLQNELSAAKGLKDESEALKSIIKAKDEEIAKMKKAMAHFLKNKNIDA